MSFLSDAAMFVSPGLRSPRNEDGASSPRTPGTSSRSNRTAPSHVIKPRKTGIKPKQDLFFISKSRLPTNQRSTKPKPSTGISLPEISTGNHGNDLFLTEVETDPHPIRGPSNLPGNINEDYCDEIGGLRDIYQEDVKCEEVKGQNREDNRFREIDFNMKIIDLVSSANGATTTPSSTSQKYRNVRSAAPHHENVLVGQDRGNCRSAEPFRRGNSEENYLKCRFQERPCSRISSFWQETNELNDLSRECCDVFGHTVCRDCSSIAERLDSKATNDESFPNILRSPSEFHTLGVARKMFPGLSAVDILKGIGAGKISLETLKKGRLTSHAEVCSIRLSSEANRKIRDHINPFHKNPDEDVDFFGSAKFGKKKHSISFLDVGRPLPAQFLPHEIEIVPVPERDRENPANYYDPPRATQEEISRQMSQPRFYAGDSKSKYKLPESKQVIDMSSAIGIMKTNLRDESLIPIERPLSSDNPGRDEARLETVEFFSERARNLDVSSDED